MAKATALKEKFLFTKVDSVLDTIFKAADSHPNVTVLATRIRAKATPTRHHTTASVALKAITAISASHSGITKLHIKAAMVVRMHGRNTAKVTANMAKGLTARRPGQVRESHVRPSASHAFR